MIEISRYTPVDEPLWNRFVADSHNATFLHDRRFMDYHSDRFADCSLIARDAGKVVALLPANVAEGVLYSHQGLTYGGWLTQRKHFDATVMLRVMDAATAWMRAEGLERLVYKPVPHIYHAYPADEDLYALFRCGATLAESNLSAAIDLHNALPFDRGNKSSVNKARKAGVVTGKSDDYASYWQLLGEVLLERHETRPVHTLDEMLLLQNRFPSNISLHTATLNGELLAGVVMFETAMVAHCQYIASSAKGRELKALALLFSDLIEQAQRSGKRYFDFGISNEDHGRYLNEGLLQQKARLGGRGVVYNVYHLTL